MKRTDMTVTIRRSGKCEKEICRIRKNEKGELFIRVDDRMIRLEKANQMFWEVTFNA